MKRASREQIGKEIASRLRGRRDEIEQAILARVHALSDPPPRGGLEYAEGLRAAVAAGLEYGLKGIERGEQAIAPVPDTLLGQARLAARFGVSLDTVLRRYFAGHTLLEDFMVEEAERTGSLDPAELKRLLRSQAAIVERLLAAVSEVYAEEQERQRTSAVDRKAERVERLLAGEPLDTGDLSYDFGGQHLGLLASGPEASRAIDTLARSLDARAFTVRRPEGVLWAWLGSRRRLDPVEIERLRSELPADLTLALGEPGEGIAAWRLSHRQACAAFPIAQRGSAPAIVRYGDVVLLASILQDDLAATSLRHLFLEPLGAERDGGKTLRQTLRAYFAAERNISSAAASLGVSWQTIKNRLQAVEARTGLSIETCGPQMELALALEAFDSHKPGRS